MRLRKRNIAAAILATPLLTGCWGEDWTAVTYWAAGKPEWFEVIGTYGSLDACAAAGQDWIRKKGTPGISTYRCGLNCEGEMVGGQFDNCELSST